MFVPLAILVTILIGAAGAALGVFRKWIDAEGTKGIPDSLQNIDYAGIFGSLAVWVLIGIVIAVCSSTPLRAAINNFFFFAGMLGGYFAYCYFVLGYVALKYAVFWGAVACAAPVLGYFIWYARGKGAVGVIISGLLLGVMLAQGLKFTGGFKVTSIPNLVSTALALIVLIRKPKESIFMILLAIAVAVLYEMFVPAF